MSFEKWVVKPLGWLRPIFIFKYFLNYLDLRFYMFERFNQSIILGCIYNLGVINIVSLVVNIFLG